MCSHGDRAAWNAANLERYRCRRKGWHIFAAQNFVVRLANRRGHKDSPMRTAKVRRRLAFPHRVQRSPLPLDRLLNSKRAFEDKGENRAFAAIPGAACTASAGILSVPKARCSLISRKAASSSDLVGTSDAVRTRSSKSLARWAAVQRATSSTGVRDLPLSISEKCWIQVSVTSSGDCAIVPSAFCRLGSS